MFITLALVLVMTKHNTPKERDGDGRYLFIYKWEMESAAYRALTGDQVRVYQDIRTRYNGRNNGAIKYCTRRAGEVIHKHHSTGARAIERLIELGFLVVSQPSSFGQKRLSREFEITAIARGKATKKSKLPEGKCDFMKLTVEDIERINLEKASQKRPRNTKRKTKHSCMGENYSCTDANKSAQVIPMRSI